MVDECLAGGQEALVKDAFPSRTIWMASSTSGEAYIQSYATDSTNFLTSAWRVSRSGCEARCRLASARVNGRCGGCSCCGSVCPDGELVGASESSVMRGDSGGGGICVC